MVKELIKKFRVIPDYKINLKIKWIIIISLISFSNEYCQQNQIEINFFNHTFEGIRLKMNYEEFKSKFKDFVEPNETDLGYGNYTHKINDKIDDIHLFYVNFYNNRCNRFIIGYLPSKIEKEGGMKKYIKKYEELFGKPEVDSSDERLHYKWTTINEHIEISLNIYENNVSVLAVTMEKGQENIFYQGKNSN